MRHHLRKISIPLWALICLLLNLPAHAQEHFATVFQVRGVVTARSLGSATTHELKMGDAVYVGERVQASSTGEAVLKTDDAGVIAIRPNAIFVVEKFAAKGSATDGQTIHILRGALRMISGWLSFSSKENYKLTTPSATVGIRGTDHEPFVISTEMSVDMDQPEGTYDKVVSGGTVLQSPVGEVAVDPGKVGFAPVVEKLRERALLTVLMPKILDRVPAFYVPGAFDDQLEALARQSMDEAVKSGRVPKVNKTAAPAPSPKPVAPAPANTPAPTLAPSTDSSGCHARQIADQWLAELDGAILVRNANDFVQKFAQDAAITARVRRSDGGVAELGFNRSELAESTFKALADLEQFSSRRPAVSARDMGGCNKLHIEAVTIESGVRSGQSYRLESLEKYDLELKGGKWIAVKAVTEQR
ncbi:hypothetical protein [Rhodoferax sp. GW822-FHT02A01]|uniref:FecR family protein n=1 Tax=Rhodoferax sp. GW822-FHT02A01 TaxID=3141537 RepID=UPI00315CD973